MDEPQIESSYIHQKKKVQKFKQNTELNNSNQYNQQQVSLQQQQPVYQSQNEGLIKQTKSMFHYQTNLFHTAKQLQLIDRFKRLIFKNQRIFSKITQKDIEIINDKSYVIQSKQEKQYNNKFLSFCKEKIQNIEDRLPILLPYEKKRVFVDIFQAILIIITLYIYSLLIFFQMHNNVQSFMLFVCIMFMVDTILNFNTGFLHKGNVVLVRREITKKYFKTNFLWDAMAFVSLIATINEEEGQIQQLTALDFTMKILIFFKILSFFEIMARINSFFVLHEQKQYILDLIRLICILITVMHVFGCIWHCIGLIEIQKWQMNNTWLHSKQINDDGDIYTRYIYSIYFLAVTMISIGYGDITPQNPSEVTAAIFIMFTTGKILFLIVIQLQFLNSKGMTFAYSINTIGQILQRIEERKKMLQKDIVTINQVLKRENIHNELRMRISNYVQYINTQENIRQREKEQEVINKLPLSLQKEMKYEIQSKFIDKIEFLIVNFSLQTIKKLIPYMEECYYNSGDIIFNCKDTSDFSFYYIIQGSVQVYLKNQESNQMIVLENLKEMQTFGEIEFFTGQSRSASVVTREYSRLLKITRENFLAVIKDNQKEFQQFCILKEELTHSKKYIKIRKSCYQCSSFTHLSQNCPKTHYNINIKNTIDRENKGVQKERTPLNQLKQRKKMKEYKSLSDIQVIQLGVLNILENQNKDEQIEEFISNFNNLPDQSMSDFDDNDIGKEEDDIYEEKKIYIPKLNSSSQDALNENDEQKKSNYIGSQKSLYSMQTKKTQNNKNSALDYEEYSTENIQQYHHLLHQQALMNSQQVIDDNINQSQDKTDSKSKEENNNGSCNNIVGNKDIKYIRKKNKKQSTKLIVQSMSKRNSITPQVAQKMLQQLQQDGQIIQEEQQKQKSIYSQKSRSKILDQQQSLHNNNNLNANLHNIANQKELELEKMKEFTYFYPYSNISVVLEQYRRSQLPQQQQYQRTLNNLNESVRQKRKTINKFHQVFNNIPQSTEAKKKFTIINKMRESSKLQNKQSNFVSNSSSPQRESERVYNNQQDSMVEQFDLIQIKQNLI